MTAQAAPEEDVAEALVTHPGPRLRDLPIYWRWFLTDPLGLAIVLPWRLIRDIALAEFTALTFLMQAVNIRLQVRKYRWRDRSVVLDPASSQPRVVDYHSRLRTRQIARWPTWVSVEAIGPCSRAIVLVMAADGALVAATNVAAGAPGLLWLARPPAEFRIHLLGAERPSAFRLQPCGRWDVYRRERRLGADRAQALRAAWPSPERRVSHIEIDEYTDWIRDHEPALPPPDQVPDGPVISVLMVTQLPDPQHLVEAINSIASQGYGRWELRLVDDGSTSDVLRRLPARLLADSRLKTIRFTHPRGYAAAMNAAIETAAGEVMLFMEQDAKLARGALGHIAAAFRDDAVDMVYADEDTIDPQGLRSLPELKPAFDAERLLSQNYIGHPVAARAELVRAVGGMRDELAGAQEHDLVLRLTERIPRGRVGHIPRILYHRRDYPGRRDLTLREPKTAERARRRAAQEHLQRKGLLADITSGPRGGNRIRWPIPNPAPSVCAVVPSKDRPDLLAACAHGILEATDYPNRRLCIVDNGSTSPAALGLLEELRAHPRVTVLTHAGEFNFSQLCNFGAAAAPSDLLAFVNDDTIVMEPDWLNEMIGYAIRPDVGAVGPKLLYPDGRIQHIGVTLGLGVLGVAGHELRGATGDSFGLQNRMLTAREVSAVTGACLVVERRKFDAVGGFDTGLKVAFNDIDLCLRLNQAGWRSLWTPHARLIHVESASRGSDELGHAAKRLSGEVDFMKRRWGESLQGDPFYHPLLSLDETASLGELTHDEVDLRTYTLDRYPGR